MPRAIVYPHKVKQMQEQRGKDRAELREMLEAHLLTPSCQTCRKDFEEALLVYREKYA